ncbi:MAG: hypothetical protein ACE5OP_01825 [Candidatus Glassbacteria bacterium]
MKIFSIIAVTLTLLLWQVLIPVFQKPLMGGEKEELEQLIEELTRRIDELEAGNEETLELLFELKRRLDELNESGEGEKSEDLSREIDDFLRVEVPEEEPPPEEVVFTSPQRQLRELNPEISILGDLIGILSLGSSVEDQGYEVEGNGSGHEHAGLDDGFELQEVELSLQAPLDPYSLAKFFVSIHDGKVEMEEAYAEWTNLPGRMQLKLGRFNNAFGTLNRWHEHAFPTNKIPLAIRNIFGEEGLVGIGGSLVFLLPSLWAHYNELALEVVNGDNERAFSGEGFEKPVGLFHLKNYYDLSAATYLEIGLSGAIGENAPGLDDETVIEGLDLSIGWAPPQRARYRSLELRAEAFFEQRDTPAGRLDTFSFLSFVDLKFARRWTGGIQFDYVQDALHKEEVAYELVPFLTFWQSEFVRLRFQYRALRESTDGWDHSLIFQSTWALGPHKHEKY